MFSRFLAAISIALRCQLKTMGQAHASALRYTLLADGSTTRPLMLLPRKEVIQPHLPIRLPCYDLALVISFTFGASLPYGLVQRLRVPPTSMA
jgi:hypothetical protein